MRTPDPFRYPTSAHVRRHGPQGYSHYRQYRDWLRDEFGFRCIYCLRRERWTQFKAEFDIDHLIPQAVRPDLATNYDNLVYSCHTCNLDKSASLLPDPHQHSYGDCVRINDDGTITPLNAEGEILIDELDLDSPQKNDYRKLILNGVNLAAAYGDSEMLRSYLGLPDDLPELKNTPPGGNSRPAGLESSWHARRARGEVDEVIE